MSWLTPEQMADKLNISVRTLTKIEGLPYSILPGINRRNIRYNEDRVNEFLLERERTHGKVRQLEELIKWQQ